MKLAASKITQKDAKTLAGRVKPDQKNDLKYYRCSDAIYIFLVF